MKLHVELRAWLQAVIKQRDYLIKNGLSKKNAYEMLNNIDFLRKRLDAFPYNTNHKIALLFQQNAEKIASLLPGEGSGGYQKRNEQYNQYYSLTKSIIDGEDISNRKNHFSGPGLQGNIRVNGQMGIYA